MRICNQPAGLRKMQSRAAPDREVAFSKWSSGALAAVDGDTSRRAQAAIEPRAL
jgi:hypothetical protein